MQLYIKILHFSITILRTAEMFNICDNRKYRIFHGPYPILPPLTGEGAEGGWGNAKNDMQPKYSCFYLPQSIIPLRGTEGASGYTLLEITITLALLFLTLAPISMMIHRNTSLIRAQQEITAMCLLEQEIARAKCRSLNILPVQRHVIDNCEWTITSTITGDKLKKVTMVAGKNNIERGRTIFYTYVEK